MAGVRMKSKPHEDPSCACKACVSWLDAGQGPQPKDLLGDPLHGCFGMVEYEIAIGEIISYLADDTRHLPRVIEGWPELEVRGWKKLFRINTVSGILDSNPSLFAMMCSCGWIDCCFFPKGTFRLSREAIERLKDHVLDRDA